MKRKVFRDRPQVSREEAETLKDYGFLRLGKPLKESKTKNK